MTATTTTLLHVLTDVASAVWAEPASICDPNSRTENTECGKRMSSDSKQQHERDLVALVVEGDPVAQERFVLLLRRRVATIAMAVLGALAADGVPITLPQITGRSIRPGRKFERVGR